MATVRNQSGPRPSDPFTPLPPVRQPEGPGWGEPGWGESVDRRGNSGIVAGPDGKGCVRNLPGPRWPLPEEEPASVCNGAALARTRSENFFLRIFDWIFGG